MSGFLIVTNSDLFINLGALQRNIVNGGKRGHYERQGRYEPRGSVAGFLLSLSTLRHAACCNWNEA